MSFGIQLDPTKPWSVRSVVIDSPAAAQQLTMPNVPAGINRVFLAASAAHDDVAAHPIMLQFISQEGNPAAISEPFAAATLQHVIAQCPLLIPAGCSLSVYAPDGALPAGKKLYLRGFYIDFITG